MRRTVTSISLAAALTIANPAWSQDLILDPRVPGLAIGRIAEDGPLALGLGRVREDAGPKVTPEILFENGSITTVFAGVLLAG